MEDHDLFQDRAWRAYALDLLQRFHCRHVRKSTERLISAPQRFSALAELLKMLADFQLFEDVEQVPFFEQDLSLLLVTFILLFVDMIEESED